jgi:hypothetical protein
MLSMAVSLVSFDQFFHNLLSVSFKGVDVKTVVFGFHKIKLNSVTAVILM